MKSTEKKINLKFTVSIVHIVQRAIFQIVYRLENIQVILVQHQIHHVVPEVHHGHVHSKKVYLVLILVHVQFVRLHQEKVLMYQQHIVYDLVQLRAIHRMIQKRLKGKFCYLQLFQFILCITNYLI